MYFLKTLQICVPCYSGVLKGLILCLRSLLPHTSGWERWSQSFTEMRSIKVKDVIIISLSLMCEATMTKNTGLNSIISWVVDLNDRKSPFHSEYSCRSEHCQMFFVYIKVIISTYSFCILIILWRFLLLRHILGV